ncbi:DinB family protein [Echinicola salinicaeni]|uniref:DinB family protein n=1 Tax=Echinicola salinicaeni TaxID=2762757 RepID=UPI0016488296|nr:DinB family protein [Echinicola salinicaeni]
MNQAELIILNFNEIRRKSIALWQGLPIEYYNWKPDENAMTAIEMVRHVLQADYGWNIIINQGDMSNYRTPWENRPFKSVEDELTFAEPYRKTFLNSVQQFSDRALADTHIVHPGNGELKPLGQYLLRIGYHESVHAGQFISYLRGMGVERPFIWD